MIIGSVMNAQTRSGAISSAVLQGERTFNRYCGNLLPGDLNLVCNLQVN